LRCVQCGDVDRSGRGWVACIAEVLDPDDEPEVFVFCPDCAERELGR
jgi:hypothetical protein